MDHSGENRQNIWKWVALLLDAAPTLTALPLGGAGPSDQRVHVLHRGQPLLSLEVTEDTLFGVSLTGECLSWSRPIGPHRLSTSKEIKPLLLALLPPRVLSAQATSDEHASSALFGRVWRALGYWVMKKGEVVTSRDGVWHARRLRLRPDGFAWRASGESAFVLPFDDAKDNANALASLDELGTHPWRIAAPGPGDRYTFVQRLKNEVELYRTADDRLFLWDTKGEPTALEIGGSRFALWTDSDGLSWIINDVGQALCIERNSLAWIGPKKPKRFAADKSFAWIDDDGHLMFCPDLNPHASHLIDRSNRLSSNGFQGASALLMLEHARCVAVMESQNPHVYFVPFDVGEREVPYVSMNISHPWPPASCASGRHLAVFMEEGYCLVDARSRTLRYGPRDGVKTQGPGRFSDDGRWLLCLSDAEVYACRLEDDAVFSLGPYVGPMRSVFDHQRGAASQSGMLSFLAHIPTEVIEKVTRLLAPLGRLSDRLSDRSFSG